MNRQTALINKKSVVLSNLGKDLYPSYGFSKARVLEYYSRVAQFILPHLRDRALTMKRYPEGVERDFFFEKRCPARRPGWVRTAEVFHGAKRLSACLANDLETLVWVENLASLELHVPLSRAQSQLAPDSVVFDLDPGDRADVLDCARVALLLKSLLANLKLSCCVKTSGKKGLHVYVPLNSGETGFESTKKFSKAVAGALQENYPDLVTAKMAREFREKKVFINWEQNDPSKTMVCAYSLRAGKVPTVSAPLAWREVEESVRRASPEGLLVTHDRVLDRVRKQGDLFREMLETRQRLPYL